MPVNTALFLLSAGCKTEDEQSFNETFNQNYPVEPKYSIEDSHDDYFKVRMRQGSPMSTKDPSRVTYLKNATTVVVENECHRRGWENWKADYISETDQGWMHVLVAEVHREPGVRMSPPSEVPPPPPATPPPPPPQ